MLLRLFRLESCCRRRVRIAELQHEDNHHHHHADPEADGLVEGWAYYACQKEDEEGGTLDSLELYLDAAEQYPAVLSRTFDPMKDQHPVKFARDELHLDDTLMQPLRTWIVQRFPGALVPEAGKMFDASPNHDLRCEVSSSERALAVFGVPAVPGSGQA